ncbi:MAG: sulfotransferase, partial [Okeania sp. SIO2D1]|nr:sulfotransferase [Okeania sp. SIO2D1]
MANNWNRGIRNKIDKQLSKYGLLPPQDWNNIQKVFIVSTGRTGTLFMSEFFKLFPEVFSCHEPNPNFWNLGINYAQGIKSSHEAVQEIEKGRRVLCSEVKRRKAQIYIESNNRLFSLVKPLREVFPDAKIVHVVRDGRDYVRSGMSRIKWYEKDDKTTIRLRADMFHNDPYANKWQQMSRFEKIAWLWQKKDGFIYQDFKELDNVISVRFEDIFNNDDRSGLFEISNFIGFSEEKTLSCL